ncbi:transmembrane protein 222 isoform X2 [Carassius gibelio]|uniref:transmembrane protein 222 isoform X2 n=1 Tax=Carassius gibelio TaxID=101364 RepID=UPI0022796258|nr:transmembrane protein 222 isoform X2 [Carassius gibelio]
MTSSRADCDGGRNRDRHNETLPRRFRENRQRDEPLSVLHRLDSHPGSDVAPALHWSHGHLHFRRRDQRLRRTLFRIRGQHGVWKTNQVRFWKLDGNKVYGDGANAWDLAVNQASEEYKTRMHNLCCDNCHSHVAMALNLMHYDNSSSWNMLNLCLLSFIHSKHVSFVGFLKTWLPFLMLCGVVVTIALAIHLR